jgi:hypothetical protein
MPHHIRGTSYGVSSSRVNVGWAGAAPPERPLALRYLDVFEGVVVISADNAWAVGTYDGWSSTLIE